MKITVYQLVNSLLTYSNFVFVQLQKDEKLVSEAQITAGKKAEIIHKFYCLFGEVKPSQISNDDPMKQLGLKPYNYYVGYFNDTPVEQAAEELFNQIYQ